MTSTKEGNDCYFAIKAYVGFDADSSTVDILEASTAKLHDSQVWDASLHGEKTSVWADKGYVCAEHEAASTRPGKVWGVMLNSPKGSPLHPLMHASTALLQWSSKQQFAM